MPRAAIPVLALVAVVCPAFAQIVPKPDGLWRGSLGAGASAASGNTESLTYTISGNAVKQTRIDKLSGSMQAVYGRREVDGAIERTSDLIRGGGKYDRNLNERAFGFGALDLEHDKLADLKLRSVFAGGLGYHVVKREAHAFDVWTGPAYNRERFTTETRETLEWLFAEESNHTLTQTVSFKQRLAYYPSLKDSGRYRVAFDTGLVIKVTDRWNATLSLTDRYQSDPQPGVKKNDLLFVTGLQYVYNP